MRAKLALSRSLAACGLLDEAFEEGWSCDIIKSVRLDYLSLCFWSSPHLLVRDFYFYVNILHRNFLHFTCYFFIEMFYSLCSGCGSTAPVLFPFRSHPCCHCAFRTERPPACPGQVYGRCWRGGGSWEVQYCFIISHYPFGEDQL